MELVTAWRCLPTLLSTSSGELSDARIDRSNAQHQRERYISTNPIRFIHKTLSGQGMSISSFPHSYLNVRHFIRVLSRPHRELDVSSTIAERESSPPSPCHALFLSITYETLIIRVFSALTTDTEGGRGGGEIDTPAPSFPG